MELITRLEQLRDEIAGARAVPLSASCMVNRSSILEIIDAALAAVPGDMLRAQETVAEKEAIVTRATEHARELVELAKAKQAALLTEQAVYAAAMAAAEELKAAADAEAAREQAEADAYVDRQLANFEVMLGRMTAEIAAGRERIAGRTTYEDLAQDRPGELVEAREASSES
ncbi:MAG: hypothetical protein EBS41_00845 [Actinobacteria bacterium]|jgi:hypothetical protein|nr:hypothetical protein [Actinomycetota bacterium]